MRGLLPLTLILALAATLGLALIAFRGPPVPAGPEPEEEDAEPGSRPSAAPRSPVLRPHETTATLAEDLRDALSTEPEELGRECWRVSRALAGKARWVLHNAVRDEASPKVRALLALAAGVHVQEDERLLELLADRWPVVRSATVLALGYDAAGATKRVFLGGVEVPLGRSLPLEVEGGLKRLAGREEDGAVKSDLEAVLRACGVSR